MTSHARSAGAVTRRDPSPRDRPSRPIGRPPRPILLFLVYGVFLVIVGVTATAQVMLASVHVSTSALNQAVGTDTQVVRGFVDDLLKPADLTAARSRPSTRPSLEAGLRSFITPRGIIRAEIRRTDGTILASDVALPGFTAADSADWRTALGGQPAVALAPAAQSEAGPGNLGTDSTLREYLPLIQDGTVVGVVGVWRDAAPIVAAIDAARRDVVVVTVTAAIAAAAVLYLVFRSAQGRITRQTVALLEATRRDPFTGMLNHGALVETIGAAIERVRASGGGLEIAIIDIDNFRILNDTWGHEAGDQAILAVNEPAADGAACLAVGRYGPDEFLIAVDGGAVGTPARVDRGRPRIDSRRCGLRFGDSNDLPLTVSGAAARFPEDGESVDRAAGQRRGHPREAHGERRRRRPSVTGFEAGPIAQSHTLRRVPGPDPRGRRQDRYTKRHSEDVARYAMFIGTRMGIAEEDLGDAAAGRAAPRRRQGRDPGPDPAQAGQADGRGVRRRQAARRAGRRDPARPARPRCRSAPASATTTSAGTAAGTCTRSPATTSRSRADPRRRGHVLGDDDEPTVPQGARPPRSADAARGRRGDAARRTAGQGLPRRARARREPAAARRRRRGPPVAAGHPRRVTADAVRATVAAALCRVRARGLGRRRGTGRGQPGRWEPSPVAGLPINTPPVPLPDAWSVVHDHELNVHGSGVLANDLDVDGDELRAEVVSGPSHGDLNLDHDGSFRYRPDDGYTGVDGFTYAADDDTIAVATTVVLTVTNVARPRTERQLLDEAGHAAVRRPARRPQERRRRRQRRADGRQGDAAVARDARHPRARRVRLCARCRVFRHRLVHVPGQRRCRPVRGRPRHDRGRQAASPS